MKKEDIKTLEETAQAFARLRNTIDDLDKNDFLNKPIVKEVLGKDGKEKEIYDIYSWAWEAQAKIDTLLAIEEMKQVLWNRGLSIKEKLEAVEKLKEFIIGES